MIVFILRLFFLSRFERFLSKYLEVSENVCTFAARDPGTRPRKGSATRRAVFFIFLWNILSKLCPSLNRFKS